jgi:hypothetical protein
MAKQPQELTTATSKFQDIGTIMKDPNLKVRLMSLVDEAVDAKSEIAKQQSTIKALRDTALEDLKLNPKLFSALVASTFNNDFAKRKTSLEEQVTMLDHIMGEVGYTKGA